MLSSCPVVDVMIRKTDEKAEKLRDGFGGSGAQSWECRRRLPVLCVVTDKEQRAKFRRGWCGVSELPGTMRYDDAIWLGARCWLIRDQRHV